MSTLSLNARSRYRNEDKANLLGVLGGVALTSNPPAMQELTERAYYVDGNGGLTFLHHNQVSDGFAFEWQLSTIWSSVGMLNSSSDETKVKFITPLDFRFFLGSETISAYVGVGLQYNTVWLFTTGDSHTYYDPWWGTHYTERDTSWDWRQ